MFFGTIQLNIFLTAEMIDKLCEFYDEQQKGRYDQNDQEYQSAAIVVHNDVSPFDGICIGNQKAQDTLMPFDCLSTAMGGEDLKIRIYSGTTLYQSPF